jgi:hypothetical protein
MSANVIDAISITSFWEKITSLFMLHRLTQTRQGKLITTLPIYEKSFIIDCRYIIFS